MLNKYGWSEWVPLSSIHGILGRKHIYIKILRTTQPQSVGTGDGQGSPAEKGGFFEEGEPIPVMHEWAVRKRKSGRMAISEGNSRRKHREVRCKTLVGGERCIGTGSPHSISRSGLWHWQGPHSLLSWGDGWDQPFTFSQSQAVLWHPGCSTYRRGPWSWQCLSRFLKHENCHLKSLNCFLSLRLKFAFIIVEECHILHGNHFKGFLDTKTLNKVPPKIPGENGNPDLLECRWFRQRVSSTSLCSWLFCT